MSSPPKNSKGSNQKSAQQAQNSAPKSSPGPCIPCGCPKRSVKSIMMKRKHMDLFGEDQYGHWWMEIDGKESYGWWPKGPVGIKETFGGTDGELNGQSNFGGSATQDPHHGDPADEQFNPMTSDGDCRTDAEINNCLRSFAKSYSGEWRWTFGRGQNCHTFQESAMEHCKLKKP
ncbi:MAG TPA: hypothetical protein VNA19_13365 [Pyrinomonadaceae bacterium]|jgi:hypothetical protein|nr:hypothetical protein [Pyrinomonadaceae bacterium]